MAADEFCHILCMTAVPGPGTSYPGNRGIIVQSRIRKKVRELVFDMTTTSAIGGIHFLDDYM